MSKIKFLQFRNRANRNPELLVYGEIDDMFGAVQSRDFAEALQGIDAEEIDVRINSDGGNVFAAQAIYSSLKRHPAKINVYIDGMAASAASIIAMAGDYIYMPENAMMMIHNPLTGVWGNAEDLRDVADVLDLVRETIVAVYREKTGLPSDKIIDLMDSETYMTAAEAKELGFVDEIGPALKIAASRSQSRGIVFNGLTIRKERIKWLPKEWQNALESFDKEPGASGKSEEKEIMNMTLDEFKASYPDLFKAVIEQGQEMERARIKAIEEMVIPGHEELAAKAKFENAISPEMFAVELVKAEKAAKERFLANREDDSKDVNKIKASVDDGQDSNEEKAKVVTSAIAQGFSARSSRKIGKGV